MKRFILITILTAIIFSNNAFTQTEPADLNKRLQGASEKANAGDTKGAILDLTAAIKIDSELSIAYFNRGVLFFNTGEFDRAEKDFSTVIMLGSRDLATDEEVKTAIGYRAYSRNQLGDIKGALEDYSKAIENDPTDFNLYFSRGTLHFKINENEKSIKDFDKVISLLNEIEESSEIMAEALFNRGSAKFNAHDYNGSIEDYKEALNLKPDFSEAKINMEKAQAFIEHESNPKTQPEEMDSVKYYFVEGNKYYMNNDADKTIEYMDHVLRLDSKFVKAYLLRGNAYFWKKEYNNTVEDMTIAISYAPEEEFAYFVRGHARMYLNQIRDAIKDFTKVIELNPEDVDAYINRALAWREMDSKEQALSDLDKAIEIAPDMAMAYFNRGNLFFFMEQYDEALEDINKTLELDPENASAYFNRSSILLRIAREKNTGIGHHKIYTDIINDANKAMSLSQSKMGVYNMASAYALSGETSEALEVLEMLLENKAVEISQVTTDVNWIHLKDNEDFKALIQKYE